VEAATPDGVVTTTLTIPAAALSGTCKLICVGLTNHRYAGLLSIITLVPASDVGKSPFQLKVPLARLLP